MLAETLAPAPMATEQLTDAGPCRTLYVRNLPERLSKAKLIELLHAAFSPYGAVAWISAEKTMKLRGQAFITFEDMTSATTALRKMHGSSFLGNMISVQYARQESDRASHDRAAARKKRRSEVKVDDVADTDIHPSHTLRMADPAKSGGVDEEEMRDVSVASTPFSSEPRLAPPPNKILFAEQLPKEGQESAADMLTDLFARFAGFVEVRAVPGKRDIAFIEFTSEETAAVALSGLQGHIVGSPPSPLVLSFAKR